MIRVLSFLVFVGILSLCFWLLSCVLRNYFYQRRIISGQKIRQQNSDIEYAKRSDVLKVKKWLKCKNFKVAPKELEKSIRVMDYSAECNSIIEKKGLIIKAKMNVSYYTYDVLFKGIDIVGVCENTNEKLTNDDEWNDIMHRCLWRIEYGQ